MSFDELKLISLYYLCLSLVDIFLLHISSHSEICYFTSFTFSDQHVTSREVSVDDLTDGERKKAVWDYVWLLIKHNFYGIEQ